LFLLAETVPKKELGEQKYKNRLGFCSVCGNPTGLAS
jgi:hypothetical protein